MSARRGTMRLRRAAAAAGLALLAVATPAASPAPQDAALPERAEQLAPPVAPPRASDEGEALRTELHEALFSRPTLVNARLEVQRGGRHRLLNLAIHHRGPGHLLIRCEGEPRTEGNVVLLYRGRLHLWFPHAELELNLPASAGGGRLFGSDFDVDDLAALGADPLAWVVVATQPDRVDGAPADRIELVHADPAAGEGRTLIWLDPDSHAPLRLEHRANDGRVLRTIEFGEVKDDMPRLWTARRAGGGDDVSRLHVGYVEPDPPVQPELFTAENLSRWR